ncbi:MULTISPECIES: UDP-glucose/GDP-mannose dehydrogenase family protein [Kribbella]|jgi:UDPglucose 6-dehydrogenase|uniref:UDP-glucose 6-dehydrogenase n=1 Tax=Kribbella pratensis TaxID=2512112 RepID=A0ABY2FR51_9ACTN|nr:MULTISPECIES: UDP-glucose/GDP-mannose dehydrogenase family protein [Kribbella]TDW95612.1 UDPglucose 6-dehydrogenase [Kribbella pratensis]TDW98943.1 UDPglucose 6-dehydrogenase [Kribbella sp. VKM Ac-2566]
MSEATSRPLRIAVIGTGYLGCNTSAGMAEFGFDVIGVEIDEHRLKLLNDGKAPLYEPGLDPLLKKHVDSGRLRFTSDYTEIADWADVHFICAGTPQLEGSEAADLSQVYSVVDMLAPLLTRPTLVVGRSTVPVGTSKAVEERMHRQAPAGSAVEIAWQPEFLREAHGVEDTLHPDRLVFGVQSAAAEARLREVFAMPIDEGSPVVVCNLPTAELVKGGANAFLATKISFINALAEMADATGADVTQLAEALGYDKRIGRGALNAGPGYGGGCLPKDLRAFMHRAGELGVEEVITLLREVDDINHHRRARIVDLTHEMLGGQWIGKNVTVLGAAFKAGTDDVRDSPALDVAGRIQLHGANVTVYDPEAMENARKVRPTLRYAPTAVEACREAHAVLHLTEWPEFRALDPVALKPVVTDPVVVDARLNLAADAWRAAGWTYRAPGRP